MAERLRSIFAPPLLLSRRDLLKRGALLLTTAPLSTSGCLGQWSRSAQEPSPQYVLRREADELFLLLTASGFREYTDILGRRLLRPADDAVDPRLIFEFPPQHFSEIAIATPPIPTTLSDSQLRAIALLPSGPSYVVFRLTDGRPIELTLDALLAWHKFELVLPNLAVLAPYGLDVDAKTPVTKVELPSGVSLSPVPQGNERFTWDTSLYSPNADWSELWNAALRSANSPIRSAIPFEVLGVSGFEHASTSGTAENGNLVVTVIDEPNVTNLEQSGQPVTIRNLDRLELATSLSRRFPYTGKPGPPTVDTGIVRYGASSVRACFADGRTIAVDDFRLSSRGGWIEIKGAWQPFPGCALTGWSHTASLGRDHHVRLTRAGFLYPFGIEAELVIVSERAFVRDDAGHFIAVLLKQSFIQVAVPNKVDLAHSETIFPSLSILTERTPPLDVPPTGDPATYADYDFFLPTVDGQPFTFEHVGTDWAGVQHSSRTPLLFVSNKARRPNGLIWEPGQPPPTQPPVPVADPDHTIPNFGDGLRVVDRFWNSRPYRFAQYGEALIAVASPLTAGDTSQRIEWAEWARGAVPAVPPDEVARRPFHHRTRTLKVRLQALSHFSGTTQYSLASYRDIRFTSHPVLDPDPTAPDSIYSANLPHRVAEPTAPYLFLLETRDLIQEPGTAPPESAETSRERIRSLYYQTLQSPSLVPAELFASIDNEVRFGVTTSNDATGGLATPDTHASTLTRRYGPVGDASFNPRRWSGYTQEQRQRLAAVERLDFAAFRRTRPPLDLLPFDQSRTPADIEMQVQKAKSLMGFFQPAPVVSAPVNAAPSSGAQSLADLFGADAQLLPGLRFIDLFRNIPVQTGMSANSDTVPAQPLEWKFRVTGADWLAQLVGTGPGQIPPAELARAAATQGQDPDTSRPEPFGVEASLNWSNTAFRRETIGPIEFRPTAATRFEIEARGNISAGTPSLPADLSRVTLPPTSASISSRAEMRDFSVSLFDAIEVEFASVSFRVHPDGRKEFSTSIRDVRLSGALGFINQLSKVVGGRSTGSGVEADISPARVVVRQTIRLPAKQGAPLFLGPAQITNLALSWSVTIPLIGRDVLAVGFAVSSRERPLTIFVPPWYGGKAHVLLELTTRGVRLLEVSMEYGALIAVSWGIASGEASLTAGIFYMMERTADGGTVVFKAFVRASASLDVAGIIHFKGEVYIALGYREVQGRRLAIGEARVSVSVKIGFVRFSFSFSATHVDEARGDSPVFAMLQGSSSEGEIGAGPNDSLERLFQPLTVCQPTIPTAPPGDAQLFGPMFDEQRRRAFERIVSGYVA